MTFRSSRVLRVLGFVFVACVAAVTARGQCDTNVVAATGGHMTAVTQVNSSAILVGKGSEVELLSLANPSVPASFSTRRKSALPSPAVKLAMTPGSPRAFALMENGDVQMLSIRYSPLLTVGFPVTINTFDAKDIVADGQIVYVLKSWGEDTFGGPGSEIAVYDLTTGSPVLVEWMNPLIPGYEFQKLAKVGNVLWAGFRERSSSIYGVTGFDVSNPSSSVRTTTSLANAPLGTFADLSAMTAVGNRLLIAYEQTFAEDWMRAVNVTNPNSVVWHTPVDLNGTAGTMASVGNLLRISIENSGIGTWDTTNPGALTWLGAYFDTTLDIKQMVSGTTTDYWAAGPTGLMTMNTTTPSAPSLRTTPLVQAPATPTVVRQRGNTTVVLDYALNTLRLYDFTLPEAQQLRGSLFLPLYSESIEIAELNGGATILACVSTSGAPGGDSVAIIDITNPAAPVLRSTIANTRARLMSASSSRLYVFNTDRQLKIYELAVPTSPQLRSTTQYGGVSTDYTCMISWNFNSMALGTRRFGVWLFDTTNAAAPQVASIWNPGNEYEVRAMTKSPLYIYVAGSERASNSATRVGRISTLNVSSITNPTLTYSHLASTTEFPLGISYVSNTAGKFLAVSFGPHFLDTTQNRLRIYHLPGGFLFNERVPFGIDGQDAIFAQGNPVPNGDGSKLFIAGGQAGLYHFGMQTQWYPYIGLQTESTQFCQGEDVFGTVAFGGQPLPTTFEWRRENVLLTDGPTPWGSVVSGATTSGITITGIRVQDQGFYSCTASNSCGSSLALMYFTVCASDFNCDRAVDSDDVIGFFGAWDAGLSSADITGDGSVDGDDVIAFFGAWDNGC
ncbi:MAG: immunoglobulin domain-containing protein [Phycisphaerales bacterium]